MSESIDPGMETSAPRLPAQTPPPAQTEAEVVGTVSFGSGLASGSEPEPAAVAPIESAVRTWKRFVSSKAFVTLVGLFLILEAVFNSGGNRDKAVAFIENDVKTPVSKVTPFKVMDVFTDEAESCSDDLYGQRCNINLTRVPGAIYASAKHVASQGLAGIIIIGLPAILIAAMILHPEEGNPWLLLNPGFWFMPVLFIGAGGWLLQLVALTALFVVEQTIAAFAVLGVLLFAYDKFELWSKVRHIARSWAKQP